ncbi:TRAP transporter small permease [Bacillus sp. JCM 19041]|uniref:TRAP transporter small permease n=1 Tax=Bacillus sp. JCM 19041 TaxID=1460637 RepID=UPI0006D17644
MKVVRYLDRYLEEFILVAILGVMVLSISAQVLMRFLFGSSIGWSEELARYCFIWLVFIGVSYGVKKQRHIKIDAILLLFNEKGKVVLNMIVNLLFFSFAVFLIVYGGAIAIQILQWGQTTPALELKMGVVYLAAPVGMLLTCIRIGQQFIKQIQYLRGINPRIDDGESEISTEPTIASGGER